ncbi:MAG: DUF2058 family protein [Alphaproteobacteria bacterium]|nr:DUF2058 family protein [Alphaproteobacteria bacterium]
MSLRDQLLKAGLADKKKAGKLARDEKKARKQAQGHKEKKKVVEAREQAARDAAADAAADARRDAARARREAQDARDRVRTVQNLLRDYRLRLRPGNHRFFFRSPDGRLALRLDLSPSVAFDLRAGRLAIGWHGDPAEPDIVVVPRDTAERVARLEPARLLFFNQTPPDPDDPAERLLGDE